MNWDDATSIAHQHLRRMADPALPLGLSPRAQWLERSWCYVFPLNSATCYDYNRDRSWLPAGPLVVPKDRTQPWVATAIPADTTRER